MSRYAQPTRIAQALTLAVLSSVMAFSSPLYADEILKPGITPATDISQIPASAKLRKDTVVVAGGAVQTDVASPDRSATEGEGTGG